ncbi:hypothetical protein [Bacillus cereus]|uniref:hypothetical protein n=1 Tax=Bacillus cereus TaxID=1396 RepID=UPI000BEB9650|nr:hypothetical protein [Bacillus cereus]PEA06257.1 hypothetical protein CON37_02480 [Bacillus cereus]
MQKISLIPPLNSCKVGFHTLTIMITTKGVNVAAGNQLWDSHYAYMKNSHKGFLITYSLSEGPELENPLDPQSNPTGKTIFVLNECYKTSEDILKHWAKTAAEWPEFNALLDWMQRPGTKVVTLHDGIIRHSLFHESCASNI